MNILKGILIGIGKIIPGVSGSAIAISLGIYKKIVNIINYQLFTRENIVFLLKIFIGLLLGIVLFGNIVYYLLNNFYSITIFVFAWLILFNVKDILKKMRAKYFYLTVISIFFIVILSFIHIDNSFSTNNYVICFIYFFAMGIIDAISTVVPGVSGTALLMLFGAYDTIIRLFSNLLNISLLIDNLSIMIPFLTGFAFGCFCSIKLVSYLFIHYNEQIYNIILGLLLGSVMIMFSNSFNNISSFNIIFLILIFIVLFLAIFKLIIKIIYR